MAETDPAVAIVTGGDIDNHKDPAKDNQSGSPDWAKDFDEGLRKKVEKFKSPVDLAKGYAELEAYSSKTLQDMTDSEKDRFFKRLALPEKPEDYELSTVKLPDDIPASPEGDKAFKELAKAIRLTKEQAKAGHEWLMTRAATSITAQRAAAKKQAEDRETALRAAWGASHDANQAAVDKVLALGGEEFVKVMNSGPGKDPAVRQGLYQISKQFADETLVSGRVKTGVQPTQRPGMVVDFSKSPELQSQTS